MSASTLYTTFIINKFKEAVVTIFLIFVTTILSIYIFAGLISIVIFIASGIIAILQNKSYFSLVISLTTQTISIIQILMDFVAYALVLIIIALMLIMNFIFTFINNFHAFNINIALWNINYYQQNGTILVSQILDYPFQFYLQILGAVNIG